MLTSNSHVARIPCWQENTSQNQTCVHDFRMTFINLCPLWLKGLQLPLGFAVPWSLQCCLRGATPGRACWDNRGIKSHLPVFHSLPTHVHLLSHAFQGKCCHRTLQPCCKGKRLPDRDGTVIKVPGRGFQIHLTLPQPASGDFRVSELVSPVPIFQFFPKALRLRKPQLS